MLGCRAFVLMSRRWRGCTWSGSESGKTGLLAKETNASGWTGDLRLYPKVDHLASWPRKSNWNTDSIELRCERCTHRGQPIHGDGQLGPHRCVTSQHQLA